MTTMSLTRVLVHGLMQSAMLENMMTAAERVSEYGRLRTEKDLHRGNPPSSDWPNEGAVAFENLSVRHGDDAPTVLKNVTFQVKGGEKVI